MSKVWGYFNEGEEMKIELPEAVMEGIARAAQIYYRKPKDVFELWTKYGMVTFVSVPDDKWVEEVQTTEKRWRQDFEKK